MNYPLEETLSFLKPHLPYELIPEGDWPALLGPARLLSDTVSCLYLECRLGKALERVDFLACVESSASARAALTVGAGDTRGWQPLHRFLTDWSQPGTLLQRQVPLIWLEYDSPATKPLAAPSLLVCLDPVAIERPASCTPERSDGPEVHRRVIESALALGTGFALTEGRRALLRACLEHLPAEARAAHFSIMSARRPIALKLNVSIPRDRVPAYLDTLGWPGNPEALCSDLQALGPELDPVQLDLTLTDTLAPRVGLEFFDLRTRQEDPGRRGLLGRCVEAGLCTPEQRDALVSWPGSVREFYRQSSWPTRVNRWVDVKLVHQPGQPLSAKAYLGARPRFSLF